MAVQNVKGEFVENKLAQVPPQYPSPAHHRGSLRSTFDRARLTGTASVNSTIVMAKVPSSAVPVPGLSKIWFDDFGTNASVLDIGDANDDDGLADGIDVATAAGSADPFSAIGVEEMGDPFWKILGYSEDPGGELEIVATLKGGAATAASDVAWLLVWKHVD